jgi:hypothetical protein
MMSLSQLMLAIFCTLEYSEISLTFYGLFLMSFGFGLGPAAFTLYGELFNINAQSILGPLAMTTFFLLNFTVSGLLTFVSQDEIWKQVMLCVFAVSSVLSGIFTYFFVPETRDRSLLEIHNE